MTKSNTVESISSSNTNRSEFAKWLDSAPRNLEKQETINGLTLSQDDWMRVSYEALKMQVPIDDFLSELVRVGLQRWEETEADAVL